MEITANNLNSLFMDYLKEDDKGRVILNMGVQSSLKLTNSVEHHLTQFFKEKGFTSIQKDRVDYNRIIYYVYGVSPQLATMFDIRVEYKEIIRDKQSKIILIGIDLAHDSNLVPEELRGEESLTKRYKYLIALQKQITSGLTAPRRVMSKKDLDNLIGVLNRHKLSLSELEYLINYIVKIGGLNGAGAVPSLLRNLDELHQKKK